jgi:hypothetical protein
MIVGAKATDKAWKGKARATATTGELQPHPQPLSGTAHRYPNLGSHFWSVTRVSTQGLLFFGRGSGRIASPAARGEAIWPPGRPESYPRYGLASTFSTPTGAADVV